MADNLVRRFVSDLAGLRAVPDVVTLGADKCTRLDAGGTQTDRRYNRSQREDGKWRIGMQVSIIGKLGGQVEFSSRTRHVCMILIYHPSIHLRLSKLTCPYQSSAYSRGGGDEPYTDLYLQHESFTLQRPERAGNVAGQE